MQDILQPPKRTAINAAIEAGGGIIDTGWQRSFYAHLDAFLSASRSIPEIIQSCFGVDAFTRMPHHEMKDWFDNKLTAGERNRRKEFRKQFEPHYKGFRALRLSTVRHFVEHRTGIAPATVTISGLFGVTHIGSPAEPVPITETRQIDDPNLAFLAKPHPIRPRWDDFDIEGQPLFRTCQEYLVRAQALVDEARGIALVVHGTSTLSSPTDVNRDCCRDTPRRGLAHAFGSRRSQPHNGGTGEKMRLSLLTADTALFLLPIGRHWHGVDLI